MIPGRILTAVLLVLILTFSMAASAYAEETAGESTGEESAAQSEEQAAAAESTGAAGGQEGNTAPLQSGQVMTNLVEGWPQMSDINEETGFLMDAENGAVLYSKDSSVIRYPASTTKILTALLVIENCAMDDTVTMTSTGTQMAAAGSTNAGTQNGETFTVEQCLYMLLLKSANDIANQLAEHCSGSMDAFVDMMNRRAAELGCVNTHFANPSGMPSSEHYSTAEDMALIMRECIKNETFLKIAGTESYTVPPTNMNGESRTYVNHNKLVVKDSGYYYAPCIAGKTGYTDAAWRTYIAAARKDGKTLICVLMRGPDKTDFKDAASLFEYGFNQFGKVEVTAGKVTIPYGITADQLTSEPVASSGETGADSLHEVRYFYNGIMVGSAYMTQAEYDTYMGVESTAATADQTSADEKNAGKKESGGKGTVGRTFLLIFLIVLVVLAGALVMRILYVQREKKRRAALRRRRRAARRQQNKDRE